MGTWIDYDQLTNDLVSVIKAGPASGYSHQPQRVEADIMDREETFAHMPYVSCTLIGEESEPRSIPNGYNVDVSFEVDIVTFNFTDMREATKVRSILVNEVKQAIHENQGFSSVALTSFIGPDTEFQAGTLEGEGANGFVASAAFVVTVQAYIDTT